MNTGSGVQFGSDGPMMTGTWFNPSTGHKFTVRDCFFQDGQFIVQTMEGQMLDYNTVQNYIQCNDADGKPLEPDTTMLTANPVKATNLPPEVASIVDADNLMLPEDVQTSKGLGNLNDARHTAPGEMRTAGYAQVAEPIDQDLAMVDRVLKRHPAPDFEAQLIWECPTKQIETLVDVLGIDPEVIAKYYVDKLNKELIFVNIKAKLSAYIREQWGPKVTASAASTEDVAVIDTPKPRPSKTRTKKTK